VAAVRSRNLRGALIVVIVGDRQELEAPGSSPDDLRPYVAALLRVEGTMGVTMSGGQSSTEPSGRPARLDRPLSNARDGPAWAGGEYRPRRQPVTPSTASTAPSPDRASFEDLTHTAARIRSAIESVIEGKSEIVRTALTVLLAEGHLLIEDVPGVGKTMLAKALARSVDCAVRRIQFTPDLLPSDITGVSVYNQERREFEFKPGAVFANIVVGDEINRASPKTQSALLECMEERQVTVDGRTYVLETPFMVIATQNPIEMEGTYPLPEAQRDRFMARVSMGYPSDVAELAMVDSHSAASPLDELEPVSDAREVAKLVDVVRTVHVSPAVKRYTINLVTATRTSPDLRLGGSPRATLHLVRAARAAAALDDRDYVLPDDIQALASPVLAHRLLPTADVQISRRTTEQVVEEIVASVPVPDSSDGRGRRGDR
jgi:MoxR-like ATPase